MKKVFSFWGPVFIWAGIIFWFSNQPTIKVTEFFLWDFLLKKTAHFGEYFILFTLLYRAVRNYSPVSAPKSFLLSLIILMGYAISDEFHQSFVLGREARLRDVIIDAIGGLMALWLIKYKLPKAPERLKLWVKNFQLI